MDQISCPVCNRDYELPRRHMKKFDELDFLPIPRLLPCLHTACHSCLEAIREKNNFGRICCPICKKEDTVKGVKYLPLDITILKQIAQVNGTEIMAVCCKCYETVPSISWCETCSSAYCEFHYSDHKLSYDTSKHNINTLKEIAHNNLAIDYKFPPISCPESLMCDCSLYCHDCMHLISADAMIKNHKSHTVQSASEIYEPMRGLVHKSADKSKANNDQCKEEVSHIQSLLHSLDEQEEKCIIQISKNFNLLHKKLKTRENELLERLGSIIESKRTALLDQLSMVSELFEDTKHAMNTAELLLSNTNKHANDAMYLVAATETVEFHSDTLTEEVTDKLSKLQPISTEVRVDFIRHELQFLNSVIASLGAIQFTADDSDEKAKNSTNTANSTNLTVDANSISGSGSKESKVEGNEYGGADGILPEICFSVQVQDAPLEDRTSSVSGSTHSASSIAASSSRSKTSQHITVEARLLHRNIRKSQSTKTLANSSSSGRVDNDESSQSETLGNLLPNGRGVLLGKIVLNTNIDRRLLSRHELHSYFESCLESDIPVMKISKELVPSQF